MTVHVSTHTSVVATEVDRFFKFILLVTAAGVSPYLSPSASGTGTYLNLTGLPEGVKSLKAMWIQFIITDHRHCNTAIQQNGCMQIELYQDLLFCVQSHNDSMHFFAGHELILLKSV